MASYETSETRHDHVAWVCNSLMDGGTGPECEAGNEVSETICRNCGKEIQKGAEALNESNQPIGEYLGNGTWKYNAYTNGDNAES